VNRHVIPALINHMLRSSIHPPALQDSLGRLLHKPSQWDYDAFASYRVIALMQTFSKIAERIINQRLIKFAKASGLYSIRQTSSLPQRSTFEPEFPLNTGSKKHKPQASKPARCSWRSKADSIMLTTAHYFGGFGQRTPPNT